MKTSPDFNAFMQKVRDTLPHADLIRERDARAWWESLDADKFNDEDWHLRRLRKIGGSESGVLVAPLYDEPAPFDQTPAHVFDRKMMRGVLEQNDAMRFGHEHEPVARKMYEERLFAMGWERDEEGMRQLSAFVSADEGSMAYSPDDLFVLKNPDGSVQKRLLPDYKSPYSGKVPGLRGDKKEPGFSYVVQLHHGFEVCRRAGLVVDELRLCFLDHPDNLAKPKEARLMVMNIEKDMELIPAIVERCDSMMRDVRAGVRPLPVDIRASASDQEVAAATLRELVDLQKDLVALAREDKALGDRLKAVREGMAQKALALLPHGKGIDAEEWGLKVIPKIAYKVAKGADEKVLTVLSDAFAARAADPTEKNPYITTALDTEKLAKFLESQGKSFADFQMPVTPNMSAVSANKDLLCELLDVEMVETNISFAVPAKLTVEDVTEDAPLADILAGDAPQERGGIKKPSEAEAQRVMANTFGGDAPQAETPSKPRKPRSRKEAVASEHPPLPEPKYAIARTMEEGLSGQYIEGPFDTPEQALSRVVVENDEMIFKVDPYSGEGPELYAPDHEEARNEKEAPTEFAVLDEFDDVSLEPAPASRESLLQQ
jgi:hypothetical protein